MKLERARNTFELVAAPHPSPLPFEVEGERGIHRMPAAA